MSLQSTYIEIPGKELGCLLYGFSLQDKVKREDIPPYSFFPLLLYPYHKDLVPHKGTGAEVFLAGWRTRSVHKDFSLCVEHEEDWVKGG